MKQRVMIAMALLTEPHLLIADEPTTALDVTIQAQILQLIRELQRNTGAAVLFITHDMGVVAEMCDDVAVMYAGRIVEQDDVYDIFRRSRHPYTRGLLRSLPQKGTPKKMELPTIEGVVPSLLDPPKFCRFADRCWKRKRLSAAEQKRCFEEDPQLRPFEGGLVACHYPFTEKSRERGYRLCRHASPRRRGPEEILSRPRRRLRRENRRRARGRRRQSLRH